MLRITGFMKRKKVLNLFAKITYNVVLYSKKRKKKQIVYDHERNYTQGSGEIIACLC